MQQQAAAPAFATHRGLHTQRRLSISTAHLEQPSQRSHAIPLSHPFSFHPSPPMPPALPRIPTHHAHPTLLFPPKLQHLQLNSNSCQFWKCKRLRWLKKCWCGRHRGMVRRKCGSARACMRFTSTAVITVVVIAMRPPSGNQCDPRPSPVSSSRFARSKVTHAAAAANAARAAWDVAACCAAAA